MAFLHDPRIKVLGTRGHMVRPRRGPLQHNLRAKHMEFKNSRRQAGVNQRRLAGQAAAVKQQRQPYTFLARRFGEGAIKSHKELSGSRRQKDQDSETTCSGFNT
jgi:hypothetical protein